MGVYKGIIKSIDYKTNTCVVRMPTFESAGNAIEVETTAVFAIQPGCYNGYLANDVVLLAFENGQISSPVIIGKLYLGAMTEAKENRGTVACDTLIVNSIVGLPIATPLINPNNKDKLSLDGSAASYNTVEDLIKNFKPMELLSRINGYDATRAQVLEHDALGMPIWVDKENLDQ